jgi:potassium-transporting ATPase potassium-binding subunit
MSGAALAQLCALVVLLLACVKPLGLYMAAVMEGRPIWIVRAGAGLERRLYAWGGVEPLQEMSWSRYALALVAFNTLGLVVMYALQRLQGWLPFNPQALPAVSAQSAFNTAASFTTNTDWQGYSGETTLSYLTQMSALTVQNFLSAATGLVVAMTLIRGFARHGVRTIGNFWVDLTRATLYVLLPLAALLALVLAGQGVVQSLASNRTVTTMEPTHYAAPKHDASGNALKDAAGNPLTTSETLTTQTLPMGPVASQESIKQLGTNGGGFFNANSAHPFENPTPVSNFLEMFAMLLVPLALTYTFGRLVGDTRQGWALIAAIGVMLVPLILCCTYAEQRGNPHLASLGVDQSLSQNQSGGNMEGKEARAGIAASALFETLTTVTSTGATVAAHDSLTPLGGLVTLFDMQLGEVIPGGVGSGLYSLLIFAIVGVFIAGLMIGRTPEYLGKKIEAFEMKMASVAILVMPFLVLVGTALAVSIEAGRSAVGNPGAHGFSEILYSFTSAANNNGSSFGGLSADTPFYDTALGVVMYLGRFWPIVAVLAISGSLAAKSRLAPTAGTMPTHGPTFIVLLIGTVLLVGVLTFVPALALGPVIEHLILWAH